MRVAYLDPPYSRYFHRLAGELVEDGEPRPLALLSSPAYKLYTGDDRVEVWPTGQVEARAKLPPELQRISRTQAADPRFYRAYAHVTNWFRRWFQQERIELCLVYSDMRVFSAAARAAADDLGVVCVYFERGAFRYRTASLSTFGLNGRFPLREAVALPQLMGIPADDPLPRRTTEPWLRTRFAAFLVRNGFAKLSSPLRALLRPRHQQLGHYIRLGLKQWITGLRQHTTRTPAPGPRQERPIVFLPLQLSADTQLQLYSPFQSNQALIEFVAAQTRRVAPKAEVWVKTHPMDLTDYPMPEGARLVHDGTPRLIRMAQAVVCINSTVGFEAAIAGKPVLCFGLSFYVQSAAIMLVSKARFARALRAALDHGDDLERGLALKAEVLRCYQSPGDVWAYTRPDLRRSAAIVRHHVAAARGAAPVLSTSRRRRRARRLAVGAAAAPLPAAAAPQSVAPSV